PALIAIGQCVYHHRRPRNPIARFVRWLSRRRSLRVLEKIQPPNGGFLEATPLTSFVTLSLASIGLADHPVRRKGAALIEECGRRWKGGECRGKWVGPDGSGPIDTNLATWVTTLAINALAAAGELEKLDRLAEVYGWLVQQQYRDIHPYTGAMPGGFSWAPLPGAVPDADDTPGAQRAPVNLRP